MTIQNKKAKDIIAKYEQEYRLPRGGVVAYLRIRHVHEVISIAEQEAIEKTRKEEREKAMEAFCQTTCPGRTDVCKVYGTNCPALKRFQTLLNED